MANSILNQTIIDGARNVVVKVDGIIDTADAVGFVIFDPTLVSTMDPANLLPVIKCRVYRITFQIKDGLQLILYWDGATPARLMELIGRSKVDFKGFGGLTNNAVTPNGKITLSTSGFTAANIYNFSIVIEMVKTQ